jgi:glyoxylase-like metal-dependent hydrolase (beta-lactamase superfamily II)
MKQTLASALLFAALTAAPAALAAGAPAPLTPPAPTNPAAFLAAADRAIGASQVTSIQYTATGWMGAVGQNFSPADDWPRTQVTSYTMTIHYPSNSSREEYVRVQGNYPARGGGQMPLQGEVRTSAFVNGASAWNVNAQGQPNAQPQNAELGRFMIAISPHGFIKSARAARDVTVTDRYVPTQNRTLKVVGFTTMDKYRVTGEFNEDFLLERLITRIPNPVMGDMQMEIRYEEWRDIAPGIKFPHLIHGHRGDHLLAPRTGMNWINLEVREARANVQNAAFAVPAAVRNAPRPAVTVTAQPLDAGVWLMAGGTHNSVAVEFRDFITVIDAPQNEARSEAVIAEIKRRIPGKPIRYLVNTHHHWDHLGGARTYVAEGATVIAHQSNKDYYDRVVFAPRTQTLEPDRLSLHPFATTGPGPSPIEGMNDRYVITDGQRILLLFHVQGLEHAGDMIISWLPQERILVNADLWTPPAQGAAPPANIGASAITLYNNIRRLNLPVATHVPIHGQPGPHADFERIVAPAAARAQQQANAN